MDEENVVLMVVEDDPEPFDAFQLVQAEPSVPPLDQSKESARASEPTETQARTLNTMLFTADIANLLFVAPGNPL